MVGHHAAKPATNASNNNNHNTLQHLPPLYKYVTLRAQVHRQNPHIPPHLLADFFDRYLPRHLLPLTVYLCLDTGYSRTADDWHGFCLAVDQLGWQLIRAQLEYWLLSVRLLSGGGGGSGGDQGGDSDVSGDSDRDSATRENGWHAALLGSHVRDLDAVAMGQQTQGLRPERLMHIRSFTEWQQLCHGLGMLRA